MDNYVSCLPLRENKPLKTKLQEASKHIPRYLFRMWHPGSGGDAKLNSTSKITPQAFRDGVNHKTVYDMTTSTFIENTTKHLQGDSGVKSEFSSWSASPRFAFHYSTKYKKSAYVAIIDTEMLREHGKNVVFHVPALQPLFDTSDSLSAAKYGTYNWEYLVHGVIQGKYYKAVPFKHLCHRGLIEHLPALNEFVNVWGPDKHPLPCLMVPYSLEEFQELYKIAKLFGPDLEAAFTIALFCCKKRTSFGTQLEEKELNEIVDVLGGRSSIPFDWSGSRGVVCDGIYDPRYEDNKQMVNVMRALFAHCWGKGARNRRTSEGTGLIPDASMEMLTEKMVLTSVDCDTSAEQSWNNSASRSYGSYDSGYGNQSYVDSGKEYTLQPRNDQTHDSCQDRAHNSNDDYILRFGHDTR